MGTGESYDELGERSANGRSAAWRDGHGGERRFAGRAGRNADLAGRRFFGRRADPGGRRRSVAILLLAGCAVDFSLGVLLQARVEGLENTATTTVFPGMAFAGGTIQTASPGPNALSHTAWDNWYGKHQLAFLLRMFREFEDRSGNDPAFQRILPPMSAQIAQARADDASMWQGWYQRHDGEMEFLGDHVAGGAGVGTKVATAFLLMLFLGLAGSVFLRTS